MIGLAILAAAHITICGLSFDVPKGWRATSVDRDDLRGDDAPRCAADLWPPRWRAVNKASIWPFDYAPARVFVDGVDRFENVANAAGFFDDEEGGWLYANSRSFAKATQLTMGRWSGIRGDGWFRGYAREDAPRDPEEGRIYSGDNAAVAMKRGKRAAAVFCLDGTPAYPVKCDAIINTIFHSIR